MMRFFSIIIVLALTPFIKSCVFSGCEKVNFNQEDLSWYKSLPNEGDTLFFRGSDNSIDTFVIGNRFREYTDCNKMAFGDYQYDEFRCAGTLINIKGKNDFFGTGFDFFFTKRNQNDSISSCNKSIQVFDLQTSGIITSLNVFKVDTIVIESLNKRLSTVFINNSKYADFDSSTNPIEIISFNWSKEYGLVRYTTRDSVVYEYWKKR